VLNGIEKMSLKFWSIAVLISMICLILVSIITQCQT